MHGFEEHFISFFCSKICSQPFNLRQITKLLKTKTKNAWFSPVLKGHSDLLVLLSIFKRPKGCRKEHLKNITYEVAL